MAPLGRTIPLPTPKAAPRLPLPGRPEGGPLSQAAARQTAPISRPPVSRGTDVQSTNGYDTQRATAYKRTPAYHHAVKQVFKAQPTRQKVAILQGLSRQHGPPSPEGLAVKDAVLELPLQQRAVLANYLKANPTPSLGSAVGGLLDTGLKDVGNILSRSQQQRGNFTQQAGVGAGPLGGLLVKVPVDVARATVQDPSVIPKTVKGLGEVAAGSIAALAELPIKAVQEGPVPAVSQLASGMAKDYSQRYGPLVAGNDNAFIARIKKQGAGPEVLDALGVAGGLDATAGRAAAGIGRASRELTGADNFLTRPRPDLRVSGSEARPQTLAPTAGRIAAQRLEDRVRKLRKPDGVPTGAGEVRPVFAGRATRVLISQTAAKTRRVMQNTLDREVRQGVGRDVRKLSPWEQKAAAVVGEGFVPLRSGRDAAVQALEARKQAILKDRAGNPLSPGNRIALQHADQVDEVRLLDALQANVGKWLTPRLAAFVDRTAARSVRLEGEDLRVRPETAEARRLRPQGEHLGIEHPDEAAARIGATAHEVGARPDQPSTLFGLKAQLTRTRAVESARQTAKAFENYDEHRPALLRSYSAKVRAAARERGLPEPFYIKHQGHPKEDFSAYAGGSGHRAMPGAKQSQFALFRGGAVNRTPHVIADSFAKQIKGAHQWRLVDEQFRRNAIRPTSAAIRSALGRDVHPADLTGHELRQALYHMGVDAKHVQFYNPGRLSEATLEDHGLLHGSRAGGAPPELDASSELHGLLNQHQIVQDGRGLAAGKAPSDVFLRSPGWKALPRDAFDEIHSSLQPSGRAGRTVGKAQGLAAGLILAGSPSFVIMNTLAHGVLAAFGTRGRILTDAAKFPFFWHGATREMRDAIDANAGGRGHFRVEKLGSTAPEGLRKSWQALQQHGIMRAASTLNPLHALFHLEDLQSNFFRRMVYYSAAKRAAIESIGRDLPLAAQAANRLQHVFTVGPKDRMASIIANQHDAEELGRYTVNMMGDYARFTAAERKWVNNRAVLFYSFLRHATRTLLYVLPVKHPIATALVGEMAKLHNDEVKQMLGGQDLPWAYSRVFFNKGGHLTSIDFMRASPVGGAAVDVGSSGISGFARMIAPELQPVLDMIYKHSVSGQAVPQNVFTALNDYLSLSYPYRLAKDLHFGGKLQQPDSLPLIHERPQVKKTKAARQYQAAKEQALAPEQQRLLGGLLGLVPKPDDSRVIAQHQAAAAAAKGKHRQRGTGGGGGGGGSFSGGFGNSFSGGF